MNYARMEQIFTLARGDLASPKDWCQGQAQRGSAQCLAWALGSAIENTTNPYLYNEKLAEREDAARIFGEVMRSDPTYMLFDPKRGNIPLLCRIPYWNDNYRRTHNEVLAAIDKCIAHCQVHQEKPLGLIQGKLEDVAIKKEFCNHGR